MNLAHYSIQRETGKQFKEKYIEFKWGKDKARIQKVTKISRSCSFWIRENVGPDDFVGLMAPFLAWKKELPITKWPWQDFPNSLLTKEEKLISHFKV